MGAELRRIDGRPVLRFERVLAHPPAKVWRVVTEPPELAHWFPAAVEIEGREMRFSFPDEVLTDVIDPTSTGEVLELDPPRVFAFRWSTDVLRFELLPHERGCLLVFTAVLGAERGAARDAVGWDTCLAALEARLDDRPFSGGGEVLGAIERYTREFGLDTGRFEDGVVRFVRDLVWRPLDEVWAVLTGGEGGREAGIGTAAGAGAGTAAEARAGAEGAAAGETGTGVPVRATNPHVPAGPLVERTPPRVLVFDSPTGRVRWEFRADPERGTSVELTHALTDPAFAPQALAAWHAHLELFFAATFGEVRCPWPERRVAELVEHYGS
ncbi:SRPBCC family protein [Saccharothrix syringae]|uniref:Activator of HSP90 ATPase n=1 Tax=Saccharothrix syringae TaxID=103733 RepID=A0A5Q0H849_SACSY|nr:SRPBCC family protein [Saccharothrix syringae]QFZ22381.1 activator of HSP90 ATPase [Saccharothrix syringae]